MLAFNSRLRRSFLHAVQTAGGQFRHVLTGNMWPQQDAAPAGVGGLWDGPKVLSTMGTPPTAGDPYG